MTKWKFVWERTIIEKQVYVDELDSEQVIYTLQHMEHLDPDAWERVLGDTGDITLRSVERVD